MSLKKNSAKWWSFYLGLSINYQEYSMVVDTCEILNIVAELYHISNTDGLLPLTCDIHKGNKLIHHSVVIMNMMASQITGVSIVYSTSCSGADKKISKLRVIGLCEGNPTVNGEFPAQRASNAEHVSILWRHHGVTLFTDAYTCHQATICLHATDALR